MAPLNSIHPLRRSERGGVSWVTLLILAVLAGSAYLAVVWVPIYVVHYEVKQTVRDYMNQAIKNPVDAILIERMCGKLASLDKRRVVREDGRAEDVPVVDVKPADVTWERDTASQPPTLRVAFEYQRRIEYPFLDKVVDWTGSIDMTNELSVPDWGPAR